MEQERAEEKEIQLTEFPIQIEKELYDELLKRAHTELAPSTLVSMLIQQIVSESDTEFAWSWTDEDEALQSHELDLDKGLNAAFIKKWCAQLLGETNAQREPYVAIRIQRVPSAGSTPVMCYSGLQNSDYLRNSYGYAYYTALANPENYGKRMYGILSVRAVTVAELCLECEHTSDTSTGSACNKCKYFARGGTLDNFEYDRKEE